MAHAFEAAMGSCTSELDQLTDVAELRRRIVKGRGLSADATAAIGQMANPIRRLCERFPPGTTYTLLGAPEVDARARPRFRVLGPAAMLDYHELVLDDAHHVVDLHVFTAGEDLSASLGAKMSAGTGDPNIESTTVLALELQRLRSAGDFAGASAVLAKLPPALRATKSMRLIALQLAQHRDPASAAAERAAYQRDFPEDRALAMNDLSEATGSDDLPKLLRAIDRVEQVVGGDPYLEALRASGYVLAHQLDAGLRSARSAVAHEPTLAIGWRTLAAIHALRRDPTAAVEALRQLEAHGVAVDAAFFDHNPVFAEVATSQAYRAWRSGTP